MIVVRSFHIHVPETKAQYDSFICSLCVWLSVQVGAVESFNDLIKQTPEQTFFYQPFSILPKSISATNRYARSK